MATFSVIKCKGLHSAGNQLSAPEGAYSQADNCIIRQRDVLEPRRGQRYWPQDYGSPTARTFGSSGDRSKAGTFYAGSLVFQYGSNKLARDPGAGATYTDYSGTYAPVSSAQQMRFMQAVENLYFNTAAGIYVLDAIAGTPSLAGVVRAMDVDRSLVALNGNPGDGWLEPDSQVAYRHTFNIKDANGTPKEGWPSGRVIVTNPANFTVPIGGITAQTNGFAKVNKVAHGFNTSDKLTLSPGEANIPAGTYTVDPSAGFTADYFQIFTAVFPGVDTASTVAQTISSGNKNVKIVVELPPGITTSHYLRLYRSPMSPSATVAPSDECFLVYEIGITSTDITNGYVEIIDRQSEVLLDTGFPLYTNPNTGDGIEQANARPPIARDICWWKNRAWYLNTVDRHRFFLSLLGVGSPAGLQNNDTITIAGQTYTAKTAPVGATEFLIWSTGTPAQNMERTAFNLINAINGNPSNTTVLAYYVSGDNEAPGKILIEERSLVGAAFSVYASRVTTWHPALTTSSSGAQTSDNSERPNGISYSKIDQPEAVPLANFLTFGTKSQEGLRVVPLRDKLYIFPDEGGIYTVSGDREPFTVECIDETTWIQGPDSAVVHGNQIYALTNQGVVAISDSGVRIVSSGLEDFLEELMAEVGDEVRQYAFGVSCETDRQYQLWLPTESTDNNCTQALIYNSLRDCWTRWEGARTWGKVNPVFDLLFLGDAGSNKIRAERRSMLAPEENYADEAVALTISAVSGTLVTLNSVASCEEGDMLWQSDAVKSLITDVDSANSRVTVASAESFANGSVELLKAYTCAAKLRPVSLAPSLLKQFRDAVVHFGRYLARNFTLRFATEKSPTESEVEVREAVGFGLNDYGATSYGDPSGPRKRRVGISAEHQEGAELEVGFTVREAWARWSWNGVSLEYEQGSERVD